jgi:hypothetical protein
MKNNGSTFRFEFGAGTICLYVVRIGGHDWRQPHDDTLLSQGQDT